MQSAKRKKLEKAGWQLGNASELLGLSDEQATYIEMKLSLSNALRELRTERKLSQAAVAKLLRSSQSRVAKMEAGDPSVSVDLLLKSLVALGVSRKEIAKTIAR